jgi:hypothetical protein
MRTFTDTTGKAWSIVINVDSIKRVKALIGVDMLDVVKGDLLERLAGDPILLCDVLYALCRPAAEAAKVTDEDFGRSMAGDVIESATNAFLEELVDFFPSRRRLLMGKALGKLKDLEQRVLAAAEKRLDSPQFEAAMEKALAQLDQEIAQTSGEASTQSPPSPE